MKNYISLRILDKLKFLIPKSIDYQALRSVLQLKMTIDSRTSTSTLQYAASNKRRRKKVKDSNRTTNRNIYTIIIYFVIGAFLSALAALPISSAESAGLVISVFMVFIGTRILSVFSTVLIDTKDRKILLSKPLDKKTIGFARNLYATYYITLMSLAIMIIPIFVDSIIYGVRYGVLLFADMILADFFLIALVALLYYYVLKFFDGEKLKNAIMIIQVALGAIVVILTHAEYILTPIALKLKTMPFHIWYFLVPGYWFSTSFNLLSGKFTTINVIGTILAFAVPIILIIGYSLVIDKFEGYLEKLDMASEGKVHKNTAIKGIIPSILCKTKEERAFYDFSIDMMKSEQIFKSKLYVQMIQSLISPFIIVFAFTQNLSFEQLRHGYWYVTLYLGSASVAGLVYMIKYSSSYKAAWIYHVAPLQNPNSAYSGALKAFFIRIILPVLIVFAIAMVTIWGVSCIPQALCLIFTTIIAIAISYKYSTVSLPFTVSFNDRPKGYKGRGFVIFGISVLGAVLQLIFSYFIPFGNYVYLLLIIITTFVVWKVIFSRKKRT